MFTKDYVDAVIRMFYRKEKAKEFLIDDLNRCQRRITKEHYKEMKNYIISR